jgi:hypothetical protein
MVLVTPWSVSSPVPVTSIVSPSAGIESRSIGCVSLKVAVGNRLVSRPRWRSWPSRRSSSLARPVRSAVISTLETVVPEMASEPVTSVVRPTAVLPPMPASVSWTR